MEKGSATAFDAPPAREFWRAPLPRSYTSFLGRKFFRFLLTVQGLGAFALITLGAIVTKVRVARQLVHPLIRHEIARCGSRLLPMFLFLSGALGFLVIGQTVSLMTRFGAGDFLGVTMVTVVVRGQPLPTA